jgi:anaerobic selenocysteine-containing dehydrogenase
VAAEADVHLAPRNGTNLMLLNGVLREVLRNGWIDAAYVAAHTLGIDRLVETVEPCTPERVARVCGVAADDVRAAAELVGTAERLVSTALQGVYQSNQATASACQVNNLHLLRGMIGRPGAGVLQMNGQPTAQNTRETGADGDLPGLRNWANPEHTRQLADLWNVDPAIVPDWAPPTHAMQIWRYAEQGSIGLLWISGTNPAVSLPDLARIRRILQREDLMVVAQDLFLTETAELADVVLPAATWGEKTGTFTNADRTVHLSEQAVAPPGDARSDLAIFLDYADRMGFEDRTGAPLIKWRDPESAFDAWKACSRGRPCDYSGLTYDKLRERGGIQWPCTEDAPDGTPRLYEDGRFSTATEDTQTYGQDMLTGAPRTEDQHRAAAPDGRAFLHAAAYQPSPEVPDGEHDLLLTTGRTIYHFHTRAKTGRAPELDAAAPDAWVELHPDDARARGIAEGDIVRVRSPRGELHARARLTAIRPGVVFVPFHYGRLGQERGEPARAANELTITAWDPVSKQPLFKVAAVSVAREAA